MCVRACVCVRGDFPCDALWIVVLTTGIPTAFRRRTVSTLTEGFQRTVQPLTGINRFRQSLTGINRFQQSLIDINRFRKPLTYINRFRQSLIDTNRFRQPLRDTNRFRQSLSTSSKARQPRSRSFHAAIRRELGNCRTSNSQNSQTVVQLCFHHGQANALLVQLAFFFSSFLFFFFFCLFFSRRTSRMRMLGLNTEFSQSFRTQMLNLRRTKESFTRGFCAKRTRHDSAGWH